MLVELARIVQDVGSEITQMRNSGVVEGRWEGTQYKTLADLRAHNLLTERLKKLAPDTPIVSEEDPAPFSGSFPDRYWLIDPIDGTASFAEGFSGYVTQVALIVNNEPRLAAIYAPALDILYVAERGRGAFANGRELYCDPNQVTGALIDNYPEPRGITRLAYDALDFTSYIECGSISLKICKVAEGIADLFFKDITVHNWDLAAPQVVLEESTGVLMDISGHEIDYSSGYEQTGIVAARTKEIAMRLISWHTRLVRK